MHEVRAEDERQTIPEPAAARNAAFPADEWRGLPPVLDPCCGGRMFWFDKTDDRALFGDIRDEIHQLTDSGAPGGKRTLEVSPDRIMDFRALPFPADAFHLVVFDPPHLTNAGRGWLSAKYGRLDATWRNDLASGFAECFRVLKPNGTLVFKWNEQDIPVSEILKLTPHKPLVGHKSGKQSKTHWIVFFKAAATPTPDDLAAARKLETWLLGVWQGDTVTARDVQRLGPNSLRTKAATAAALDLLAKRRRVTFVEAPAKGRGRPSTIYLIDRRNIVAGAG